LQNNGLSHPRPRNFGLDIGGTVGLAGGKVRSEQDWREQLTEEAWTFLEAFVIWTREHLGEVRVDTALGPT
jgi:hypothetical protein